MVKEKIFIETFYTSRGFEKMGQHLKVLTRNLRGYNEITANQSQILGASVAARQKSALTYQTIGREVTNVSQKYAQMNQDIISTGKTAADGMMKEDVATREQTGILAESIGVRQKGNAVISTSSRNIGIFDAKLDNANRNASRFKMEYLGIMFAGMALDRAMTSLNATSREWLGIGELTSTMMGITMLSANMDLLEFGVLPLFDALTNMPGPAQKAVGYLSIALEGLGMALMVGGQLMLGLYSMQGVWPKAFAAIGGVTGALKGLAGIGLIGVAITLGISSITSEGGVSILYALGAGLAAALGGIMYGASIPLGLTIGGIVVAALLTINAVVEQINYEKDLKKRMEEGLYNTATPMEQVYRGFSPTGGQGTMTNYGAEDFKFNLPEDWMNSLPLGDNSTYGPQLYNNTSSDGNDFFRRVNDAVIGPSGNIITTNPQDYLIATKDPNSLSSGEVTLNVTYNINVSDKRELEAMFRKNNQALTSEVRRMVKT